jgi:hypothetical protein
MSGEAGGFGICRGCGSHWSEIGTGGRCRLCAAVREGRPWYQLVARHVPVMQTRRPPDREAGS